jgi:hypothetical protein
MQDISSVNKLEELKLLLKQCVVRDLINKKKIKETYKVKEGKFENQKLWILKGLKGYAFMKDLVNHGKDEYAEYKIFIVTKHKLTLVKSLSNENNIMFQKTESNAGLVYKWSDLKRLFHYVN